MSPEPWPSSTVSVSVGLAYQPLWIAGVSVAVVIGAVVSMLNDSETRPELPTTPETAAADACANASAGVNVMPLPPEPDVPTVVTVTVSGFAPAESTVIVVPATRPVTLATLTFVAPAAAAAASVVAVVTVTPHDLLYVPSVETVSSTQPFFVAVRGAVSVGKPDQTTLPGSCTSRSRRPGSPA